MMHDRSQNHERALHRHSPSLARQQNKPRTREKREKNEKKSYLEVDLDIARRQPYTITLLTLRLTTIASLSPSKAIAKSKPLLPDPYPSIEDIRPWLTFSEETSTEPSEGDTTDAVSSSPLKSSFLSFFFFWIGEGARVYV